MNISMKEFTSNIEKKLDQAYRSGASKKYGYDSISNQSDLNTVIEDEREGKKENKMLNKM